MEQMVVMLLLLAVALLIVGPIAGIIGAVKAGRARREIEQLRFELDALRHGDVARTSGASPDILARLNAITTRIVRLENEMESVARGTAPEVTEPTLSREPAQEAVPGPVPPESIQKESPVPEEAAVPGTSKFPSPDTEHLPPPKPPPIPAFQPVGDTRALASTETQRKPHPPWVVKLAPEIDRKLPSFRVPTDSASLEMLAGKKWLNWAGAIMMLMGIAYLLKYAYDNSFIGPVGRLAIGTFWGIAALAVGERFRRKEWPALFQTLTGIGLAIFYLCIFFSFQVYHLSGAGASFTAAIVVTLLAITLAVAHNAMSIAVMAVIGGFMSPVLLSTGENHPYALFTYIAILDLVAMGAAYFRRWRALEFLCFAGTALMFSGWYAKFLHSDPNSQLEPALIFTTVFYLMFLVIPSLYSIVKRLPDTSEGVLLIILNALFSLAMYYRILYPGHAQMMGFFVLGQAVLVFLLFHVRQKRMGTRGVTSESLLIIALGLITTAVPLHLKFFGIPLAWAVEGALLTWAGLQYRHVLVRIIGVIALMLSIFHLLYKLPLHNVVFTPVFNPAFGTWLFVAAACFLAAWFLYRRNRTEALLNGEQFLIGIEFVMGFGVLALLLTMEVEAYWYLVNPVSNYRSYLAGSEVVLWSTISVVVVYILQRKNLYSDAWRVLSAICYCMGFMMFFWGIDRYRGDSTNLLLNPEFLTRMAYPAALWIGAALLVKTQRQSASVLEGFGFVLVAILLAVELRRWGLAQQDHSFRLINSLVSAVWALQAFGLIWFGLATRARFRRALGFVLFAIVIGKVLLFDTSQLEKIYRIISFLATGVLLLAASYFYHRYGSVLLSKAADETDERRETSEIAPQ